jgi:muconolactone delta-isomerase
VFIRGAKSPKFTDVNNSDKIPQKEGERRKKMKFLVVMEGVAGAPMPPEQMLPLTKEIWAWSRRMLETKKANVTYGLADHAGGLMGGCGIMNVDSLEELAENLASCPAAGIATMRVYPLVSQETAEKLVEGALAALPKK